jgi:hypothetical protein
MRLDRSDFDKKMRSFEKKHPSIIERILIKTGDQVVIDANEIEPKTPHDENQLRSEVQVKALKYNLIMIWFMMVYAARHHEADPPFNWKETGVGAKYLEKKFVMFAEKYGKLMAALHRSEVNRA